jgi:hypothetical protein
MIIGGYFVVWCLTGPARNGFYFSQVNVWSDHLIDSPRTVVYHIFYTHHESRAYMSALKQFHDRYSSIPLRNDNGSFADETFAA